MFQYSTLSKSILIVILFFSLSSDVLALKALDDLKAQIGVDEHLGEKIDKKLDFRNYRDEDVLLEKYVAGDKPLVMSLNYYSCETLCGVQLNALLNGLKQLDWIPGKDFRAVTISIDPDETPELANKKRDNYLKQLQKEGASWEFLVGEQEQISSIADQVGYRYTYDEKNKQYAHPAVVMVLSPDGTISRYIYGLDYKGRDLKFALMEAAEGKIGSTVDKVILSCFIYDDTTGQYTASIFGLMRLAGALTVFVLGTLVTILWRRDLREARETKREPRSVK